MIVAIDGRGSVIVLPQRVRPRAKIGRSPVKARKIASQSPNLGT
jgi:hypothetical protein